MATLGTRGIVQESYAGLILHKPVPTHAATLAEVCSEDVPYRTDKIGSFLESSVEKINRFHEKKH